MMQARKMVPVAGLIAALAVGGAAEIGVAKKKKPKPKATTVTATGRIVDPAANTIVIEGTVQSAPVCRSRTIRISDFTAVSDPVRVTSNSQGKFSSGPLRYANYLVEALPRYGKKPCKIASVEVRF